MRGRADRLFVQAESSEAGVPLAVLAEIGGGALVAMIGRGAVVIGEAAGGRARPVIVEVADLVGQRRVMVAIVARLGKGWCYGHHEQHGGEREKLHFGHLDSPKYPTERRLFWPIRVPFSAESGEKLREISHTASIFGLPGMLNEIPTQSRQSSEAWSTVGIGLPAS